MGRDVNIPISTVDKTERMSKNIVDLAALSTKMTELTFIEHST